MIRLSFAVYLLLVVPSLCQADLVGYWPFDGDVMDASGTENHGDLIGGAYSDSVPSVLGAGQSISFEDPLDHVFIEASPSLNSNIFTLSMFINDQEQFEAINRLTSRQSDTFETGIDQAFGTGSLAFYSSSAGWVTTGEVPEIDQWQHVAFVATGEEMTVYLDGDAIFGPSPFASAPNGFMHIGNRWNDVEGFFGLIDDVALWNVALTDQDIVDLSNGAKSPLDIVTVTPPPPPTPFLTVGSSIDTWTLSTEVIDGGDAGDWDPSGDPAPPDVSTFTLEPVATAADSVGHINAAAQILGVEGIAADADTNYYRTTFELDRTTGITAELELAVDNGAQVYINGELIATETSFLVDNWNLPLPSISFASDGSLTGNKFEDVAASFAGWVEGENEILLAVRNPFTETSPAGGFAFRLDFYGDSLPGDFDGNGIIDATDIDLLNMEILGEQSLAFDLTGDGSVNALDRDELVTGIIGTWYGDSNLDGEFNSSDLVVVFTAGKYELLTDAGWAEGDWSGDGLFSSADLVVAFQNGGYELGPRTAVAIPEPTTGILLGLGVFLGSVRRRVRTSS